MSLSGTQQEKRNPREIIAQAKKSLPFSGETAIETFRKYADKHDFEGLFGYFIEVVEHGQISASDAHTIIQICETTNSVLVREAAIEVFAQMYPEDVDIKTMLAKVYAKRPASREKAIRTINEAIGLDFDESGEYCSVNKARLSHNNLARFFDTYMAFEAYNELVAAGEYLLHNGAEKETDLINLNIFNALRRQHRLDEAEKMLPLIEARADDRAYYAIAMYYDMIDQQRECYVYFEKALFADPLDDAYFQMMATQILNEHMIRVDEDTIVDVSAHEAQIAAAPFLFYVLQRTRRNDVMNNMLAILRRPFNGLTSYVEPARQYLRGEIDGLPYDEMDLRPLQYCLSEIEANMH